MSDEPTPQQNPKTQQTIRWIILAVIGGVLIFNWWSDRNRPPARSVADATRSPRVESTRGNADLDLSVKPGDSTAEPDPQNGSSAELPKPPIQADVANAPSVPKADQPVPVATKQTSPPVRGPPTSGNQNQPVDSTKAGTPQQKSATQPTNKSVAQQPANKPASKPNQPKSNQPKPAQPRVEGLKVHDVVIRNLDDEVVYRGTVDLTKTLARIDDEKILPEFRHDGVEFKNFERRLPIKPRGHYREWVFPTSGQRGPGPQRVVSGKDGEAYYTWDHYEHFVRIRSGR